MDVVLELHLQKITNLMVFLFSLRLFIYKDAFIT